MCYLGASVAVVLSVDVAFQLMTLSGGLVVEHVKAVCLIYLID